MGWPIDRLRLKKKDGLRRRRRRTLGVASTLSIAGCLVLLFVGITVTLIDFAADVVDAEGRTDMKVSIPAVNAYLRHCATAVEEKAAQRLRVVMGNEASDLDSIVSAIFYASWLHLDRDSDREQKEAEEGKPLADGLLTVPLINIPRDDFGLRGDAVHVLDKAGIEHEHLLFLDDVSTQNGGKWTLQQLNEGVGFESVVLVDHNRLAAHQRGLAPLVKEVLDHHVDETSFLPALEQRNLNPSVGSACTLVAEKVLSTGHVDEGGATALLTTILLDTVLFDPAAKRSSPLDKSIATSLTKVLLKDKPDDAKSVGMVQAMLYASANIARNDITGYSTQELLRKDYKQWALTVNTKSVKYATSTL